MVEQGRISGLGQQAVQATAFEARTTGEEDGGGGVVFDRLARGDFADGDLDVGDVLAAEPVGAGHGHLEAAAAKGSAGSEEVQAAHDEQAVEHLEFGGDQTGGFVGAAAGFSRG